MKILSKEPTLLTNFEVYQLVKGISSDKSSPQNVQTILYETANYFEKCAISVTKLSVQKLEEILESLKKYKLIKAERLQMINLWPKNLIDLHVIIEECEERFSEPELEEILRIFTISEE